MIQKKPRAKKMFDNQLYTVYRFGMPPKETNLMKLARKTLGYTQKQMGEAIGIDPNTVARLERGEHNMTGTTKKAIELLLRVHELEKRGTKS